MEPKFVLPSPNFNKSNKDPSKANLHYLTPCGMTLLPRSKQPPPMYGARGSTVPAKYLEQGHQQHEIITENNHSFNAISQHTPPIYNSPRSFEFCSNCSMNLATPQDMKRHLEQHEPCPVDDCHFAAMKSVLEQHIEAKHITGLYKTVKKVWTPEDIAAWRAERRKRFPTAANVETANRAKEQRMKRGERLEASKARFGNAEDRRRSRPQRNCQDRSKSVRKRNNNSKQRNVKKEVKKLSPNPEAIENPSSKETINIGSTRVSMFCGTTHMDGFKHVKEKDKTNTNPLSGLLGMYGTDSEDDDEEEDDAKEEPKEKEEGEEQKEEDEMEEESRASKETVVLQPSEENCQMQIAASVEDDAFEAELAIDCTSKLLEVIDADVIGSSSDEAPDEAPIERKTELVSPDAAPLQVNNSSDKPKLNTKSGDKRVLRRKRPYGLNIRRARQTTKPNTMLFKLLATDIRHERNVLLQCVRYVCEQKFFGIGDSAVNK